MQLKKLLIINFALLLLIIVAIILPDVYINGSSSFNLTYFLARTELEILVGVLIAVAATSFLLGIPRIGMGAYLVRVVRANTLMTSLFLIFIVYHAVLGLHEFQNEYESLLSECKTRAESDIKNGVIVYEYAGGFRIGLDSATELKSKKIDSIRATYGIEERDLGCMTSTALMKAQSQYYVFTKPYLDRRNGKGWEGRMEKQILEISGNCNL